MTTAGADENTARKESSSLPWIILAVALVLLGILAAPFISRERTAAQHTKAVSHARNIAFALFEFEQSFGSFPDAGTARIIGQKSGRPLHFDLASSNGHFSQLIETGVVSDELIFHAETAYSKRTVNHDKSLDPGEVGYGYLLDGTCGFTSAGNPA